MNCILSIYSSLSVYLLFRQCICYDLTMNLLEVLKSQNTSRRVRKCNYIFMQMFYQMTYAAKAVRLQRQVFLAKVGRSIKCWGTSSCNIRTRIDGKVSPPTWNSVIHERSWKYSGIVHCESRDNIMSVRSRFWLLGSRVIQLADNIKREFTEADDRKSLTRSVPRTLVEYMRILSRYPYLHFMRSNWIIKSSRTYNNLFVSINWRFKWNLDKGIKLYELMKHVGARIISTLTRHFRMMNDDQFQRIDARNAIICLGSDVRCNQFVNRSSSPRAQ